jgi:hypothetical protein
MDIYTFVSFLLLLGSIYWAYTKRNSILTIVPFLQKATLQERKEVFYTSFTKDLAVMFVFAGAIFTSTNIYFTVGKYVNMQLNAYIQSLCISIITNTVIFIILTIINRLTFEIKYYKY